MKLISKEVDGVEKPENKDSSLKALSKLEDYIDLVPEKEREFEVLVERVKGLDNLASSLIIGHINQCSQVLHTPTSDQTLRTSLSYVTVRLNC